jgi:hypothetical protein
VLRELFEIEVFRFLRTRELLSRERMELILSWPHSGFNVHVGEAVAPDDKISLTRVARYMLRASVVMSCISYDRNRATVHIDPHGPHSEGPIELDVLDFIARLMVQKVWQGDPLLCPRCGGKMRIISFITDQTVIDKILRHIGFKHADTPPPRYHPPPRFCRSPLG